MNIAIIPSNGREFLRDCLAFLAPQVDHVIVVSNGGNTFEPSGNITVAPDLGDGMNISRWWNTGLDAASVLVPDGQPWNALVVNDDVVVPQTFVQRLSECLRLSGAALAFPNQHDSQRIIWHEPGPVNLFHRITGYCFMLRGETGLRFDENLVWWYGDDDMDWRARQVGGSYLVPGCPVQHRAPNGTMFEHPELHVQAGIDRQTFIDKWGQAPW